MELKESLESYYEDSHPRSLSDDTKDVEGKKEELIKLLLEVPLDYYGINYKEFIPTMYAHLFYHDDLNLIIKSSEEIAHTFVANNLIPDWIAAIMVVIDKVRPKPELEYLREFVDALQRTKNQDDEILSLINNLPKWARQAVEILQESDGIKNNDLMTRLRKNELPISYKHISELFKEESANAFYKENITSDSAYYKLQGTDFNP